MTLKEAIIHAETVADRCAVTDGNIKCEMEHRQLAEWLKELKAVHNEIDDAADEDEIFIGYLRKKMSGE